MTTENTQLAKQSVSQGERFTGMIIKELTSLTGEVKITDFQKKLAQNYFIKIDAVLKEAERKRMAKAEDKRDLLAYSWENINSTKLATDVIAYSSIGLDPLQPNHINIIPFKNTSSNKYDINFMMGYRGMELKASKFGVEEIDVIVELVYTNDKFKSFKKDQDRKVEGYSFVIEDDFDRGDLKGGFYYHRYKNNPEKNKLRVFNMKDIEKRIPKYASAEFWGGEKDKWEKGKVVGKELIEGWRDEMVFKTIARAAYNDITIDSEKINDHLLRMLRNDEEYHSQSYTEISSSPAKQGNLKEFNIDEAEEAEIIADEPKQLDAAKETAKIPDAVAKAEKVKADNIKEPLVDKAGIPQLNFD